MTPKTTWIVLLALTCLTWGCTGAGGFIDDDDDDSSGVPGDDDAGDDDAVDDDTGDDDTGDDDTSADCSGGSGAATGGQFLDVGGASTWLYVPSSLVPCAPMILHGHGGSSPGGLAQDGGWNDQLGTGLIHEADDLGFVLMVPFLEDAPHTNHIWNSGEVDDLTAMIQTAAALADLDMDRVLFAGQSAGGHMAVYYGLYDYPHELSYVAVVSAGTASVPYPAQEPSVKLPFFVAHDPSDQVVPYLYSELLAADLDAHGHDHVFDDYDLGANGHGWSLELTEDLLDWWLNY